MIGITTFALMAALWPVTKSVLAEVSQRLGVLVFFAGCQGFAQVLLFYVLHKLRGRPVLELLERIGHRRRLDSYYWEAVFAACAFLMLAIPASASPAITDPEARLLPAVLIGILAWSTAAILRNLSISDKMLKFELRRIHRPVDG